MRSSNPQEDLEELEDDYNDDDKESDEEKTSIGEYIFFVFLFAVCFYGVINPLSSVPPPPTGGSPSAQPVSLFRLTSSIAFFGSFVIIAPFFKQTTHDLIFKMGWYFSLIITMLSAIYSLHTSYYLGIGGRLPLHSYELETNIMLICIAIFLITIVFHFYAKLVLLPEIEAEEKVEKQNKEQDTTSQYNAGYTSEMSEYVDDIEETSNDSMITVATFFIALFLLLACIWFFIAPFSASFTGMLFYESTYTPYNLNRLVAGVFFIGLLAHLTHWLRPKLVLMAWYAVVLLCGASCVYSQSTGRFLGLGGILSLGGIVPINPNTQELESITLYFCMGLLLVTVLCHILFYMFGASIEEAEE